MVASVARTPFDGEPPLTPSQLAAVISDGHTLLAAGAGSGKTTTLVDKILFALGADRAPGRAPARACELHEIAAITFTNSAAADLKRKLRARLRTVADWHAARGETDEASRWRARVYAVDRARIGTIHSFCGEILREHALRLGLDPAFTILEAADSAQMLSECVDTVLDAALIDRPSAMQLVEVLGLTRTHTLVESLARRGDAVEHALASWFDETGPLVDALRTLVMTQRTEWGCTDDVGLWREALDPLAAELCGELLEIARRAQQQMAARLDDTSSLDFDAMIARTHEALQGDHEMLMAVRRSLAWLFIDEFQDTDREQLDIAYLISAFSDERPAGAPSLCIVGDPKQSIYRFRRADVSLWGQTEADFRGRGIAPIMLDTNFRSLTPIVGYVNATFSRLIGNSPAAVLESGNDIPYVPLIAHRAPPKDASAVELLAVPAVDGKVDVQRAAEAESVVARMFEMVGGEQLIWDDRTRAFRAAEWRDIAILVRARTPFPALEAAFRAHGVPYYLASGDGFFARREIVDARLLLSALADRHDDIAWLGLLRSPFIALTDEAIFRARLAQPGPIAALLDTAPLAADESLFARARTLRDGLSALRDRVSVAELIEHALDESGYVAQLLTQPGGELAAMNLRKLVHLAESRPSDSVADFLEFITGRADSDARESDAALFTAGESVVTVTTVHSAKGLEWPIVFLIDLDRELAGGRVPDVFADADAGVALKLGASSTSEKDVVHPGAWEYFKQRELALSLAEEKRLWYVAATRARDRLVLCAKLQDVDEAVAVRGFEGKEGPRKVKHWLLCALSRNGDRLTYHDGVTHDLPHSAPAHRVTERRESPPLPALDRIVAARTSLDPTMAVRLAPIGITRTLPRYSATQLMLLAKNPDDYRKRYLLGMPERRVVARNGTSAPTGVSAKILGEVLHGALEEDRDEAELLEYLEVELGSRLGESRHSPRVRAATARLRKLVHQSREHPDVARLYDAEESERELPFTWFSHDDDGTVVIRGAMDLVATTNGVPEILDFKSHDLRAGAEMRTAAEYRVQLQVYAAAYHAITGVVPGNFTFFFSETSTPVPNPIDDMTVLEAAAMVRALVAEVRATNE